jgi:hypothetical protein
MRLQTQKRTNPLDRTMTKAQVVRRRFKSSLPRSIENRPLSALEAMARTMELFDRLRNEMRSDGLDASDVQAALVYCQPETKGKELVLAEVVALPTPEKIGPFVERVMKIDRPLFLGVVFIQQDHKAEKAEQRLTAFCAPFMVGPEAEDRLLGAMRQQAAGGLKKVAN